MTEEQQEHGAQKMPKAPYGNLVIIGGGEDRKYDKKILARFIELSGGVDKKIVVITAASKIADEMWKIYDQAFADIGVNTRVPLHVNRRADANDPALIAEVSSADGIFMTGGDQKRLLAMIGGTRLDETMHRALKERHICIGGTSAGASAMSGHMLAYGKVDRQPEIGAIGLGAGLGFLQHVVVDQHFSERHRLPRLLSIVAQNPYLLGIGIDENTALIVARGYGIEVIGDGLVTVVDGRQMVSNVADVHDHECPEMIDVRLHLLPAGTRYLLCLDQDGHDMTRQAPAPLDEFLQIVTRRT